MATVQQLQNYVAEGFTPDGIPYGTRTIITERASPCYVNMVRLEEGGEGYVKELADGRFRVKALAQLCGVKNRNNRVYPYPVWERHLTPGTTFQAAIGERGVIGHLEHPDDGKSKMPLGAVVIIEASPPNERGEVWIVFETMSTPPGKIVEGYIRSRVRFGLSSRGNGSVLNTVWEGTEKADVVQEDFEPITWDCVIDESTPGAQVAARKLKESIDKYVQTLMESAGGDVEKARELAQRDIQEALIRDSVVGRCVGRITESESTAPPSGYSRYLLAFEDGSAHYRAYRGTAGQWEVWIHPHNLQPEMLATKIPTLDACQMAAENHYRLILASGAYSAQKHAAMSNAIGAEGASPTARPVAAPGMPNIAGMAAMMPRNRQQRRPPSKIMLSFESLQEVRSQFQTWLKGVQEEWKQLRAMPYSGTIVRVGGVTAESAVTAIAESGMFADSRRGLVYVSYEDGHQATEHVQRFLQRKGHKQSTVEAVGVIRRGRAILEDIMGRLGIAEQGMAGGDTVPDDTEEPEGISPYYKGEDPENLDLDTDVNEDDEPIDYDYDETYEVEEEPGYDYDDDMPEQDMDYGGPDMDYEEPEYEQDMDYEEPYENMMGAAYESEDTMGKTAVGKPTRGAQAAMFDKAFGGASGERTRVEARRSGSVRRPIRREDSARKYHRTFQRHKLAENGKKQVVGAVRVWFNEGDEPVAYEYYNRDGILEIVRDGKGRTVHRGGVQESTGKVTRRRNKRTGEISAFDSTGTLLESRNKHGVVTFSRAMAKSHEMWEDEDGNAIRPPVFEDELPARHGGKSGVTTKSTEYQGREGPEYSKSTAFQSKTSSGDIGSADKPGDYDKASEEGDGKHVEKGTFPESVQELQEISKAVERQFDQIGDALESARGLGWEDVRDTAKRCGKVYSTLNKFWARLRESARANHRVSDLREGDTYSESYVKHLKEKHSYLEDELAKYEALCQEQHETISALREAQRDGELEAATAAVFERFPELRKVEGRLLACESVADLHAEVNSLVSLVESVRPDPTPAPDPMPAGGRNGITSDNIQGAPAGPLNESSSTLSERLTGETRSSQRGGVVSSMGTGDVASRVAAHRKRRRRR